jgi:PAS domain S-box-containing protein
MNLSEVGGRYWQMSSDLFGAMSPEGRYHDVNPAWRNVLGWCAAELQQGIYLELVHPDDRHASQLMLRRFEEGTGDIRFENRLRGKDGYYRWFSSVVIKIDDAYLSCGKDVTAEKIQALELLKTSAERDRLRARSRTS